MKKVSVIHVMMGVVAFFLVSCASDAGKETYSPSERAYVDSLVYADRSIDSLLVVADRFEQDGNVLGQVAAYRELGRAYRNATRYQEAIDVHMKGLEKAKVIRDTLQIVQALNNIGTAYRRMGVLEEAAAWHYNALAWCEEWSDTTALALKNRVVSLNGLGNVQLSMGKDSLAMSSFREALSEETVLGSVVGMAINYANIGALFEDHGKIDSARYYYSRSLECNVKAGSDLGISLCRNHFGRLAEKEGDLDEAFQEYKAAYDLLSESPDKWHWLDPCTSLARVSKDLGRMNDSRRYLSEAMSVAEALGSAAHLADIYHLCYMIDAEAGRYKESLAFLEKYSECMNRLYVERKEDAIFELRSKYEREKNRQEIRIMQEIHKQKIRRDRMFLGSMLFILIFAILAIIFLVSSLRLRSRNNRILKELNQTKSNYFTNVAHEFRTPLTVILSAADSIRANSEDDGMKNDASDISRHSKDLLNLVNQVLDIAKMTSGIAPDPVWRKGNAVAFISGVCERNRRYAESRDLAIQFNYQEDPIELDFVPDLMLRIVRNLLSNALKYSYWGTTVHVSVSRVMSKGTEMLSVTVRDNGIGLSQSHVKEIFRPFWQAEGGLREMGTGVGLAVVKLAAETMGGEISVNSELGVGSEFVVTIPIRHDLAASSVQEAVEEAEVYGCEVPSVSSVEDSVSSDLDVPRILIVEDAPDVARWEMRQLGGAGYAFYFAGNGAEGLRKAEEIVPDLVITDLMMPVMDGLEMCRRMRASELLCHIPVVMVTARATHEDRLKGLEAGADAYLEKPYDENELNLRVRKLLMQREMLKRKFSAYFDASVSETAGESPVSVSDRHFLEKFDTALEEAFMSGKVDCEALASEMCIGRAQLNRKIKAITGYRTTEYILLARLSKAKQLLRETDLPVGEISMQCGIEDVGYFSTLFRKQTGITPSAYRAGK